MRRSWLRLLLATLPLIVILDGASRHGRVHAGLVRLWDGRSEKPLDFEIRDATASSGLDFHFSSVKLVGPVSPIEPFLISAGVSVAITDYNNDGFEDVYVTTPDINRPNQMFRNNGDGTFANVTDELFDPKANSNYLSQRAVFFDCDNDGFQDVFFPAYPCPKLFHNDGGKKFTDITDQSDFACNGNYAANVVDIDGDGKLDIVYATYIHFTPDKLLDNFENADISDQKVAVYHNEGHCKFKKMEGTGIRNTGLTHAIGIADLRGLNRRDLWFVSDYGPDHIFFDNGDGTYTDKSDLLKWAPNHHGMAFDTYYPDAATRPLIYISHMFEPGFGVEGNALWRVEGDDLKNYADSMGVSHCGFAWGGKFIDLNNDGLPDLLVASGFISRSRKKNYAFATTLLRQAPRFFVKDPEHWPPIGDASLFGYEKKCLFMNDGKTFRGVEANAWTEDLSDGRGIAAFDPLNDGSMSFVVGNQNQDLKFFQTRQLNQNNWIGLKLIGNSDNGCSSRDAFGAKVSLHVGARIMTQYYYPPNGFAAQSQSRLHFGLGDSRRVDSAEIIWPSGLVEKISDLKLNSYNLIKEGNCGRNGQAAARDR